MIAVLAFNDRYRLAVLETALRRTDREFVVRIEHIAGMLQPPARRDAPPPLDDAAGPHTWRRAAPATKHRFRKWRGGLGRCWLQMLATLWAAGLIALGITATTVTGTVVCSCAAAALFVLIGHRWVAFCFTRVRRRAPVSP